MTSTTRRLLLGAGATAPFAFMRSPVAQIRRGDELTVGVWGGMQERILREFVATPLEQQHGVKINFVLGGTPERAPRLSASQVEALQLVMDKEGRKERERLERKLPWLATIGSVSPLIGLFGTVIGVINAFLGVAATGSGNISAVAPGVAEALVATAMALAVAIPAVFGYNAFANRLNHLDGELESFGTDLIALLVRDGRI